MTTLRDAFVERLPEPHRAALAAEGELGARLDALVAAARAAWPDLCLTAEGFVRHLADRAPEGAGEAWLGDVVAADLYLAAACAGGDAAAVTAFHALHDATIRAAAREVAPAAADEVAQRVREKLLVAAPGEEPAICKYAGRGSLSGWVRVVTVREAYTHHRRAAREPIDELDVMVERAVEAHDPELALLKRRYKSAVKKAFGGAFDALDARERNLLRYAYVDGMTIDDLAQLHGVHRATAARWRNAARERLFEETRRVLVEELDVSASDVTSILRLVGSQLELSSLERDERGDRAEGMGEDR